MKLYLKFNVISTLEVYGMYTQTHTHKHALCYVQLTKIGKDFRFSIIHTPIWIRNVNENVLAINKLKS